MPEAFVTCSADCLLAAEACSLQEAEMRNLWVAWSHFSSTADIVLSASAGANQSQQSPQLSCCALSCVLPVLLV